MVSLATFFRWNGSQRLGGVIGMVGLQGLKISDEEETPSKTSMQKQTPLLLCNGKLDNVIPIVHATKSYSHFSEKLQVNSLEIY